MPVYRCRWNEWEKDNILDDTRVVCLVCDVAEQNIADLLQHMNESHGLDLVKKMMGLDTYQRMKLVNFIRKQTYNGTCWSCQKEVGNPVQLAKHFTEVETPVKVRLRLLNQRKLFRTSRQLSCGIRRSI